MRFGVWGDRRHWEVFLGRLRVYRWCPGAPCQYKGARYRPHWVRMTFRR